MIKRYCDVKKCGKEIKEEELYYNFEMMVGVLLKPLAEELVVNEKDTSKIICKKCKEEILDTYFR